MFVRDADNIFFFQTEITCATFDELRLSVSFSRLKEVCSCTINKCSCRNECAKSMISNKFPFSIGCILEPRLNQLKQNRTISYLFLIYICLQRRL